MSESRFIFVTCQIGAEPAVKGELRGSGRRFDSPIHGQVF